MKQAKRQLAGSGEALPAGAVGEYKTSSTLIGANLVNSGTPRALAQVTGVTKGVYLVLGCISYDSASVADGYSYIDLYDGTNIINSARSYSRVSSTLDGSISVFGMVNVLTDNTTLSVRCSRTAGQMFINTQLISVIRIA